MIEKKNFILWFECENNTTKVILNFELEITITSFEK
jgi:hypothetical protein